jgi:DDE superfamily endonuclease
MPQACEGPTGLGLSSPSRSGLSSGCVDESSKQLIKETRTPIPMKSGRPARYDYEYERNGTANLFMMFVPLEGWRHVKVTDRHTAVDYALVLKELSDTRFPDAEKIVLVQDNLNTHTPASLYEAFPADEARRLVERFEWPTRLNTKKKRENSAIASSSAAALLSFSISTPSVVGSCMVLAVGFRADLSSTPRCSLSEQATSTRRS